MYKLIKNSFSTNNNHLLELNALRGIAALFVAFHHYTDGYEINFGHKGNWPIQFHKGGEIGVCIFLVLSGFVIIMSLSKGSARGGIITFWFKRIIRLYPSYLVAVTITAILVAIFGLEGRETSLIETLINFSMIQGLIGVPHVDGAYWTLLVELRVYFIVGLIWFLVSKRDINNMQYICGAWLVLSLFVRIINNRSDISVINIIDYILVTDWSFLFIIGICLNLVYQKKGNILFLTLIILSSIIYGFWIKGFYYGIITIGVTSIFNLIIYNKLRILKMNSLIFMGYISYSFYLIHQNIGYIIIMQMEKAGFHSELIVIFPLIIVFIIAVLITFILEKPIRSKLSKNLLPIGERLDKIACYRFFRTERDTERGA